MTHEQLSQAVMLECSCGGGGHEDSHTCPACRVYHRLVNPRLVRPRKPKVHQPEPDATTPAEWRIRMRRWACAYMICRLWQTIQAPTERAPMNLLAFVAVQAAIQCRNASQRPTP